MFYIIKQELHHQQPLEYSYMEGTHDDISMEDPEDFYVVPK